MKGVQDSCSLFHIITTYSRLI